MAQGVACVVFVVIGSWPMPALSSVEHMLVPPQIVPRTHSPAYCFKFGHDEQKEPCLSVFHVHSLADG